MQASMQSIFPRRRNKKAPAYMQALLIQKMDSGLKYINQCSMAIICPQSGSGLSHPPLLRFRWHLSMDILYANQLLDAI